jgi:hypothetical protein
MFQGRRRCTRLSLPQLQAKSAKEESASDYKKFDSELGTTDQENSSDADQRFRGRIEMGFGIECSQKDIRPSALLLGCSTPPHTAPTKVSSTLAWREKLARIADRCCTGNITVSDCVPRLAGSAP